MLVNFLFLFQGLSLYWYFLGGGDSPYRGAGRFFRTVAIILAVLVPFLSTATVMVGIGDMWLDFPKPFQEE
jgi:hypothetical protein